GGADLAIHFAQSSGQRIERSLELVVECHGRRREASRIMRGQYCQVKAIQRGNFNGQNHLTRFAAGRTMVRQVAVLSSLLLIGLSTWGRNGFDGGKDARDACRAPSPRKSGGTQRNCEHAARSRCLTNP